MSDVYHSPGIGPKKAGPSVHDAARALLDRIAGHDTNAAPRRRLGDWPTVVALREALGTQTTDEVLWEGEWVWVEFLGGPPPESAPPGTRVRVVRAADRCPECGGEGARGCGAAWHDPHRATDQPSEDQP